MHVKRSLVGQSSSAQDGACAAQCCRKGTHGCACPPSRAPVARAARPCPAQKPERPRWLSGTGQLERYLSAQSASGSQMTPRQRCSALSKTRGVPLVPSAHAMLAGAHAMNFKTCLSCFWRWHGPDKSHSLVVPGLPGKVSSKTIC